MSHIDYASILRDSPALPVCRQLFYKKQAMLLSFSIKCLSLWENKDKLIRVLRGFLFAALSPLQELANSDLWNNPPCDSYSYITYKVAFPRVEIMLTPPCKINKYCFNCNINVTKLKIGVSEVVFQKLRFWTDLLWKDSTWSIHRFFQLALKHILVEGKHLVQITLFNLHRNL